MLSIQKNAKIVFLSKPTSLAKGVHALSSIVSNELGMDFNPNTYFLFTNFKRSMLKILYFDGTSLSLWFKQLNGTLSFKFSNETIIFDEVGFSNFINKITRKKRYSFEKK
jgi:transposase